MTKEESKKRLKGAMKKAHPGFNAVQDHIESEGYSSKEAGAILASRTRHASAVAHKANSHLSRVK